MRGLPTGTVTFLFTDIEDSTKLWERSPKPMQRALTRHEEILRSATEEHDGYVFKTVGDAFCCAFSTTGDALEAALKAQRALLAKVGWPEETGPLRLLRPSAQPSGEAALRRSRRTGAPLAGDPRASARPAS
jgi:class 3 adenylate cyclase